MKTLKLTVCIIIIILLAALSFLSCEKEKKVVGASEGFMFPDLGGANNDVYDQIKKTCSEYWDLSQMIDDTFEIKMDYGEYVVSCNGYSEGALHRFVLRLDQNGHFINGGNSLIE